MLVFLVFMSASVPAAPAPEPAHILVVDDEEEIRLLLSRYLTAQGMRASCVPDAGRMRERMESGGIDLVLLDLGLPDGDGLDVMREMRQRWDGPVIVITGRGESVERVVGLELGADDYVTKPFDLRELLARIRTVLRRVRAPAPAGNTLDRYEFAGWTLETGARRLLRDDAEEVPLTTGEYDLLSAFLNSPQQVLSRDQLMDTLHGRESGPYDRAIDVQVGRLRRKLERDPASPELIKSVRGIGYMLAVTVQRR